MDEYDNEEQNEILDPNIRKQLREAERTRKEASEAMAELSSLKREMAFTKAGIPEHGTGNLLRKAYDGELTPEAIRKAAEEYGILGQQTSQPANDVAEHELESMRRIAGAATSAGGGIPSDAGQQFLAAIADATNEEQAMQVVTQYYRTNPELGFSPRGAFY